MGYMIADTPIAKIYDIHIVRTVAVARITMQMSMVRLSAGRTKMSDELQAMAFFAGANSLFTGDKLLTTPNPGDSHDHQLVESLGMKIEKGTVPANCPSVANA